MALLIGDCSSFRECMPALKTKAVIALEAEGVAMLSVERAL